jgi:hypothetical protein
MPVNYVEKPNSCCANCGENAEGEALVKNVRQVSWVHRACLNKHIDQLLKSDPHLEVQYPLDEYVVFK